MNSTLAVGFLWPFDGASLWESFVLLVLSLGILAVLPAGWLLIRRRFGVSAAGPLWPLAAFLVLGSLYALLTPPWQTPDEPRHMVYVELVRRAGTSLPSQLAAREPMSEEQWILNSDVHASVARSLQQVDRWPSDPQHIINAGGIPGPSEVVHPPLYYVLASSLTSPLGDAPILARVGLLRAFGVMVGGWVVWLAGAAGRSLWPRRRIAEAPMAVAVGIPAFTALAGTVNSDVLANLFSAILVVLALVVARRNVPIRRWHVGSLATVVLLGVLTKRSFLPVVPVVLVIVLLRRRFTLRQVLGASIALQLLIGLTILTSPATIPPVWSGSKGAARCEGGADGEYALCGVRPGASVYQPLTVSTAERLSGAEATVGFWARARDTAVVSVSVGARPELQTVGREWTFHRVVVPVPVIQRYEDPANRQLQRRISVVVNSDAEASIDGVVLAVGSFPDTPPEYDRNGDEVLWGGARVQNLIANGSAEDGVVSLPRWLPSSVQRAGQGAIDAAYLLFRNNDRIFEASDVIRHRLGGAFGIFWGTVGWDQPPRLMSPVFLWILAAVTGLGLAAAALAPPTHDGRVWHDRRGVVAITAVGGVIVAVIFRGIPPTDTELLSGRYLFPAVVGIAVCLVAGWRSLLTIDDARLRRWARWFAASTQATFLLTVFLPFRLG